MKAHDYAQNIICNARDPCPPALVTIQKG